VWRRVLRRSHALASYLPSHSLGEGQKETLRMAYRSRLQNRTSAQGRTEQTLRRQPTPCKPRYVAFRFFCCGVVLLRCSDARADPARVGQPKAARGLLALAM